MFLVRHPRVFFPTLIFVSYPDISCPDIHLEGKIKESIAFHVGINDLFKDENRKAIYE